MNNFGNLTNRELEVLKLVARGYSNPEIAKQLFISVHTVKIHLENIFYKLDVHNKVQASIMGIKRKIINIEQF